MKNKQQQQKGFTLLELLLVVGIAAILIVAGITTYNLVNRGNQINDSVRLVNVLMDQVRRLYSSNGNYGTANLETALYNSGVVPGKYKSATAGVINTPFDTTATAISITGSNASFIVTINVPASYVPEFLNNFNPANNTDIQSIDACSVTSGGTTTTIKTVDAAQLATACGSTNTLKDVKLTVK